MAETSAATIEPAVHRGPLSQGELDLMAAYIRQAVRDKLVDHKHYVSEHGEDMPEIQDWTWRRPAGE